MAYHRNNWQQAANNVADFIPFGHGVMAVVNIAKGIADEVGIERLDYRPDGHPVVERPWQPPGPPPDPTRVEAVGRRAWDALFADTDRYPARSLLDQVGNLLVPLPPSELDLVIRRFGPQGLLRWDELMHVTDAGGEEAYDFYRQQEVFNWLLRTVSPYATMLIGDSMPCTQPTYQVLPEDERRGGTPGWVLPAGPFAQIDGAYFTESWQRVSASTEPMSWQDMDQGRFGTCWMLTAMQAVLQANPTYAPRHLRQEANGSVTFTLYENGRPYDVTVVADLPMVGNMLYGAKGHSDDPRYAETWPGYYEKAVAQWYRGYEEIANGGYAARALAFLTAQPVQEIDISSPWLIHEMADRKSRGQAVTVGTKGHGSDRETLMGGRLATSHAYFVKDVDVPGGRICLGNPWGDGASRQMWEAWLSYQDIQYYLAHAEAAFTW
ncbi:MULTISPECIES: C2 family cysteine protease [Kitasatospora]|uniref:Calpain catalytic domain-containing protein n=1 Tax=Kitasatospora cystarginea TaxID=58350 RepID=A0ABN3EGJ0_9ACTN